MHMVKYILISCVTQRSSIMNSHITLFLSEDLLQDYQYICIHKEEKWCTENGVTTKRI